jgi:hypothetical protein
MEQIKDSIGVDTDSSTDGRRVGLVTTGRIGQLANRRRGHGLCGLNIVLVLVLVIVIVIVEIPQGGLAGLSTNTLGDVDAGLGGVAGLAGVEGMIGVSDDAVRVGALPLRNRPANGGGAVVRATIFSGCGVALLGRGITRRCLNAVVEEVGRRVGAAEGDPLALASLGGTRRRRHGWLD